MLDSGILLVRNTLRAEQLSLYTELMSQKGTWIAKTPIPSQTLETREIRLEGRDRELLLKLMRKILCWLPEDRPSAEDLYNDGFIYQFVEYVTKLEEATSEVSGPNEG